MKINFDLAFSPSKMVRNLQRKFHYVFFLLRLFVCTSEPDIKRHKMVFLVHILYSFLTCILLLSSASKIIRWQFLQHKTYKEKEMFIFEMIFCVKFNWGLLEDLFPRAHFSFMDYSIQGAVVMPFL